MGSQRAAAAQGRQRLQGHLVVPFQGGVPLSQLLERQSVGGRASEAFQIPQQSGQIHLAGAAQKAHLRLQGTQPALPTELGHQPGGGHQGDTTRRQRHGRRRKRKRGHRSLPINMTPAGA